MISHKKLLQTKFLTKNQETVVHDPLAPMIFLENVAINPNLDLNVKGNINSLKMKN